MSLINLTEKKFTRLLVINRAPNNKYGKSTWNCVCDCGTVVVVAAGNLKSGNTQSCGCLSRELASNRLRTHGKLNTKEYRSWKGMKSRCINVNDKDFKRYGGRGIYVCARWLNSFENFFSDMGKKPSLLHSIDRENNNGNYTPDNCRWATPTEQARNRRSNKKITFNNRTQCISAWAEELNIHESTLAERLKKWPLERAMTAQKTTKEH